MESEGIMLIKIDISDCMVTWKNGQGASPRVVCCTHVSYLVVGTYSLPSKILVMFDFVQSLTTNFL